MVDRLDYLGLGRVEADEGRQRGILVPVLIDNGLRLPLAFRLMQAANLAGWQGEKAHAEFVKVVRALTDLLGKPPTPINLLEKTDHPIAPVVEPPSSATETTIRNSIGMEFIRIPAGEFRMGSTDGIDNERPVHTVHISRAFYLGKYPVTQGQWQAVMGNNPSHFTGDLHRPVEQVSWEDAQTFIGKLNAQEGVALYRLPTEAEWEYAARAGTTTAYSFGDDSQQLPDYAWYADNSGVTTQPVGQRKPNPWGLYDMHGNVWEWVQDWYGAYAAAAVTDPQGPAAGSSRVIRGGGWYNVAKGCRSALRVSVAPDARYGNLGLRLLRTAP